MGTRKLQGWSSKLPVPLSQLGQRTQEMGRIRIGVKSAPRTSKAGNAYQKPEALDTFRLTSPDEAAITQAAAVFGGVARPWHDDRAVPSDQFEVITPAKELRIFLPEDCFTIWYEHWDPKAGGLMRRCDGVTVQVGKGGGGDYEINDEPCRCAIEGALLCKMKGRLKVVLPDLPFGGVWRLDSSSENMAAELPAMQQFIADLQLRGLLTAKMVLEQRAMQGGRSKGYVVKLVLDHSPAELIDGAGRVASLARGDGGQVELVQTTGRPALAPAPWVEDATDDEVEIVDDGTDHLGSDPGAPVVSATKWSLLEQAVERLAETGELISGDDLLAVAGADPTRKLQGIVDGVAKVVVRKDGSLAVVKAQTGAQT